MLFFLSEWPLIQLLINSSPKEKGLHRSDCDKHIFFNVHFVFISIHLKIPSMRWWGSFKPLLRLQLHLLVYISEWSSAVVDDLRQLTQITNSCLGFSWLTELTSLLKSFRYQCWKVTNYIKWSTVLTYNLTFSILCHLIHQLTIWRIVTLFSSTTFPSTTEVWVWVFRDVTCQTYDHLIIWCIVVGVNHPKVAVTKLLQLLTC